MAKTPSGKKNTKALAYDNGIVVDVDAGPSRTWAKSPGTYLAGRAAIDEADAEAAMAEEFWGVGRLRLLVGTELRERFDRQRYLFNQAIWHGTLEDVKREAARMAKAWRALHAAAKEAGHRPIGAEVWETTFSDGTVVALVRTCAEAHKVIADGRKVVVYTLDEVRTLLEGSRLVNVVKATFPGATVERASAVPGEPLNAFSDSRAELDKIWDEGDELPW
jgi:hypothetical protein